MYFNKKNLVKTIIGVGSSLFGVGAMAQEVSTNNATGLGCMIVSIINATNPSHQFKIMNIDNGNVGSLSYDDLGINNVYPTNLSVYISIYNEKCSASPHTLIRMATYELTVNVDGSSSSRQLSCDKGSCDEITFSPKSWNPWYSAHN